MPSSARSERRRASGRSWPLVEESGQIIGAIGHHLAAADPDEQVEELPLHRLRPGSAGGLGERRVGKPDRARVDLEIGDGFEELPIRGSRQQGGEQRILARSRGIDLVRQRGHSEALFDLRL